MWLKNKWNALKEKWHNHCELKCVSKKGKNNYVFGHVDFVHYNNISIGNDCRFNHGAYINAFNPIILGNDVTISAGAKLITTGIDYQKWSNGQRVHISGKGIFIGDHVWVGANAVILNNVKITGEYVVVAAGAEVSAAGAVEPPHPTNNVAAIATLMIALSNFFFIICPPFD